MANRKKVWVESMGMASGYGFKKVYRFLDITYPYSSCICSFLAAASLLFVHFLILIVIFINIIIIGKRKRAHPCLLNLSNFCYIYLFIYRFIYIYISGRTSYTCS